MSSAYLSIADLPGAKSWSCALDPAMLPVPIERSGNAISQADRWSVADLLACPRDVERAALGEEIDAPPEDWRLDAERQADRLARGACHPERPDRQVERRARHARDLSNRFDQLVQRSHFPARKDVRAVGCRGVLAAEPKAFDQIIDVGEMVVDFSRS